jgi:DNA-binding HxlR family transcriptional regulator
MLENFKSGDDYAQTLIQSIVESENNIPKSERMDPELFRIWVKVITKKCNKKWNSYMIGEIEEFLLDEEEFTKTFQQATETMISDTLGDLVDKNMVKVAIDDNGEFVYSLTDQGQEVAKNLK